MEEQNKTNTSLEEINLLELVGKVLSRWKFVLIVTICFMALGVVVALSSSKEYTAQVVVSPETSTSGMGGGLASLASLAGVDMGGSDDAIYPLLYPDIIQATPFLCSLLDVNVKTVDGCVDTTYLHYMKVLRKKTWIDKVKNFPGTMLAKMTTLFEKKEIVASNSSVFDPYRLSKKQVMLVEALKSSINVLVDKKTEVITLSFTDRDPLVAAMMVDTIKARLQERITEYRTKKAILDCEYMEKLYLESKAEYEKAQELYAEYVDRNRNVTQERFLVEKERLAADRDFKNSLYMQWAQQLQLAKAKVQEKTPAFTTLKPAAVPALSSSMSRFMVLALFTFFGCALAVVYVLLKDYVVDIWRELFGKKED